MRALLGALAIVVIGGCAEPPRGPAPPLAQVVEVIDGDTIVVRSGPHTESLRLIGIDTPEVAHHGKPAECHGDEAAAFLRTLLPAGTTVTLHRDDEARDVYGRLLAYVGTTDGRSVNLAVAAEGHAVPLSMSPNLALADHIATAAADARAAGLGLWHRCPADP